MIKNKLDPPCAVDFAVLFESVPDPYLVLDHDLVIVAVSHAYARATRKQRSDIIGKGIFDVFPDTPNDPAAKSARNLKASLFQVLQSRQPDAMPVETYDIQKPDSESGGFEERFWSSINTPVFDAKGHVTHIIHRVEDVTEFVRLRQQGVERDKRAKALSVQIEKTDAEVFACSCEVAAASAELKRVNEELDELKTRFFSNMSHEIRTPMNAILGLTQLLKRNNPTREQSERLDKITNASTHLLSILNDILDFSKIEAGKLTLENTDFSIRTTLDQARALMIEVAQAKGLTIEVDHDSSPRWLNGDQTRIRQALLNYLSNSIKFTDKGGIIMRSLLVEQKDNEVLLRFEVQDTGVGIDSKIISELFHPFIQGDASITRQYGGAGLGLTISQRLAALMRGEVGVESKVGQGSTFWFTAWLKVGQPPSQFYSIPIGPETEEVDTLKSQLQTIAGLDLNQGLECLSGKIKMFLPLLLEFVENHQNDMKRLRAALDSDDSKKSIMIVNKLRGSSGTLGFINIQNDAAKLEMNLRQGNVELAELINHIDVQLEVVKSSVAKLKKDVVPTVHPDLLKATEYLNELRPLLFSANFKASQMYEAQVPLLQASLNESVFLKLNCKMHEYDYLEALKIVDDFLK